MRCEGGGQGGHVSIMWRLVPCKGAGNLKVGRAVSRTRCHDCRGEHEEFEGRQACMNGRGTEYHP